MSKGTSLFNLSHPSSKLSLFEELPCSNVQLCFRYRALWGPFACSVQEQERKFCFKPAYLEGLLHHNFSVSFWFEAHGQSICCSALYNLSESLHRVASASSIRSVICLPNSACMGRENGYSPGSAIIRYPPAFKPKSILYPNSCSLAAVPHSNTCTTTFVNMRDILLSTKNKI